MTKGIYAYFDKQRNEIVYIGKDSRINIDRRHKEHNAPIWKYTYRDENNKKKKFSSTKIEDLKKKVELHGLPWIKY